MLSRNSDVFFFTGKQDKILKTNHSAEICSRAGVSFLTIRGEKSGVSHGTAVSVKADEEQAWREQRLTQNFLRSMKKKMQQQILDVPSAEGQEGDMKDPQAGVSWEQEVWGEQGSC